MTKYLLSYEHHLQKKAHDHLTIW